MLAATSPTACLSMPLTVSLLLPSTVKRDARGRVDGDGVREAEGELDRVALLRDAVTGSDDLEALGVALGDTDDLVGDEGAGQAVQRTRLALVVGTGDEQPGPLRSLTSMGLATVSASSPFGPLTATSWPSIVMVDASGDVDGESSNTRHVRLPHVGEDFPTHALLLGLAVGEQTGGGGQDGDAEATEDRGDLGRLRVDAQAGLRDALDAGDGALAVRAVLEVEGEGLADAGVLDLPGGDVALALEDLGDVRLELASSAATRSRGAPSSRCAVGSACLRPDLSLS